jgi:hypothetical protein
MDLVVELVTTFWQWVIVGVIVLAGWLCTKFDGHGEERVGFKHATMPKMMPLPIGTADKGFWKGVWLWLMGVRQWEIAEDWQFEVNGQKHVIPAGFQFDGASVPKFLATFLSPVGVLLMGGLVHDYIYKYATLLKDTKKRPNCGVMTQKEADILFRDICIEVNGFKVLNYLAYWSLRLAGFVAWNGHTKRGTQIG